MIRRLLVGACLLAATACASANRNANGSSGQFILVKNESVSTIELYVSEGADGKLMRRVTKLAPSETYKYRGPFPASQQQYLQFSGGPVSSGVAVEARGWVSCHPISAGSVTCK
jgi:hypothetical protein